MYVIVSGIIVTAAMMAGQAERKERHPNFFPFGNPSPFRLKQNEAIEHFDHATFVISWNVMHAQVRPTKLAQPASMKPTNAIRFIRKQDHHDGYK